MNDEAIAIIGVSGRFPGASSIESFWENICKGKESISTFSDEELRSAGVAEKLIHSPSYVKKRGALDSIEDFDASFFAISQREAELMDPQHRLFLECSWEALEDAGYCADRFDGKIGVFGGSSRSTYFLNHIYPTLDKQNEPNEYLTRVGNENDYLATRVAYKLNAKGPSMTVQTACSTSLVAVSVACTHLLSGQCDMALAGAVSVFCPGKHGYVYQKEMILSPDGCCRPFDAEARGTVPGDGVGIVVLKRLNRALEDGDAIYAVIRGFGINNDGREKIGYSAPSVQGQTEAIRLALAMAKIDADSVGYVEAHGTATLLGDPIEIKAIMNAHAGRKSECAIGSIKGNIGHLMEAAGMAGLIKAVLSLKHKKIAPSLHFKKLNPHIQLNNSPFYINTDLKEWEAQNGPRRAGVSSFGFGGTNVHLILEEAPKQEQSEPTEEWQRLEFSAKTPEALEKLIAETGLFLQNHADLSLRDIAYTLRVGRKQWKCRKAFVCQDIKQLVALLLGGGSTNEAEGAEEEVFASHQKGRRVHLPTYPFEKKRYWMAPPPVERAGPNEVPDLPAAALALERGRVEARLIDIWKSVLGCSEISREDDFFALGGESLLAFDVVARIEKAFGVTLSLHSIYEAPTIAKLSQTILDSSSAKQIILLKTGEGQAPLFLIHQIDGSIFAYKELSSLMKFSGPIYGIRAHEEKEIATIEEIARSYIEEMKKVQPLGPYHLFGASFGGLIAYEIAQQLRAQEEGVGNLIMLDIINPNLEEMKQTDSSEMRRALLELLEGVEVESKLSFAQIGETLLSHFGYTRLAQRNQDLILRQIDRHLLCIQKYKPQPFPGKVLYIEMNQKSSRFQNLSLAASWNALATVSAIELEGNHRNMLKPPQIQKLAEQLDCFLC